MSYVKKSVTALFAGAVLTVGAAAPASAATQQDGLVNVNIGDVTILEDVRVNVVAQLVAQVCGTKVGPIAVLGRAVDRSGATGATTCTATGAPVTITN